MTNIDLSDLNPKDNYGKECLELLREFQRHDISYMEFRVATALKVVEKAESYKFVDTPEPPQVLSEFNADRELPAWQRLTQDKRDKITSKVMAYPEVKKYISKLSKTETENLSNAEFIEENMIVLLKAGMFSASDRLHSVYQTFPDVMFNWKKGDWYEKERAKAIRKNSSTKDDSSSGQAVVGSGEGKGEAP